MPRNQLTKDEIKCEVLKLKRNLNNFHQHEDRRLADVYLNKVLDKIDEYRN